RDETGRSFIVQGELLQDGKAVQKVSSNGRNPVEKPGDYVVKAGVLLQDGSIYKPVTATVTIDKPRKPAVVDLKVVRPAIVSASFAEDGESHRGALVDAYSKGKKAFSFRPFDEALARPGDYEFRANPNQDNVLRVPAKLEEGQHTVVDFDLVKTVKFKIEFRGPGGERVRKNSSLSRGGKKIYFIHARNGGRAVPGSYELHMDDPKTPLPKPAKVEIKSEGQTIIVDLPAAYLTVTFEGSPDDFLRKPNRSFVGRFDPVKNKFLGASYTRVETPVSLSPGRYRVEAHYNTGYFDPVEVQLASGERKTVTLRAKPLGKVILRYDPGSNFKRKPKRAFIRPQDGQKLIGCNCSLETELKVPPGRYVAEAHYVAGEFPKQEFTVTTGKTTTVTLSNR
ncbi:MAG: hypothetical protein P8J20_02925, partial [Novosphingobium sp.]|nr:hypothetical protein [Novosphingobium sp.]